MITVHEAVQIVESAGYQSMSGWEDETLVYAWSIKSIPGTFGHPAFEVSYNKETHWLTVTGKTPCKLA